MNFSEELEKYFGKYEKESEESEKDTVLKGIWIPNEILFAKNINPREKILLSVIFALSKSRFGCIASNEYLADFCMVSKRQIAYQIKALVAKRILKKSKEQCTGRRKIEIDFSGF